MDPTQQISQSLPQQQSTGALPPDLNVIQQAQQQFTQRQQSLNQLKQRQQQEDQATPSAISQAIAQLNPNSKSPVAQIGKSIATPSYAGYCLQWVDDQTGNQNRQPNAFADYQEKAQQGSIDYSTKDIPKGARVYFAPDSSNGQMGHVGLSNGDGTFTSATDNGIKTFSVQDWEKYTGQSFLGYAK